MSAGEAIPAALFVYRRHRELERTLSCLHEAGIERLYIFSDGPGDPDAAEDVAIVRSGCRHRLGRAEVVDIMRTSD